VGTTAGIFRPPKGYYEHKIDCVIYLKSKLESEFTKLSIGKTPDTTSPRVSPRFPRPRNASLSRPGAISARVSMIPVSIPFSLPCRSRGYALGRHPAQPTRMQFVNRTQPWDSISNQGWFRLAMDAEAGLRERDPRRAEGGCLDRAAGERLHGFWVSTLPEAVLRVVAFHSDTSVLGGRCSARQGLRNWLGPK